MSTSPGRRAPRGLTYRSTRRPASVSKTDDSRRAGATARAPEAPPLPRARVSASTSVSASRSDEPSARPCREQPRTNERRSATTGEHRARARPRAVGIMVVETTEQRVTIEGARLDARVPRRGVRGRREEDGLSRPQTGFLFESSQTEKKPTIDFARLSDPSKKVQPKSRPRACAIFSPPKSIKVDRVPSASPFLIERAPEAARPSRVRPRDHDGTSSATLPASRTPRRCRLSAPQRAPGAPSRSLAVSRPAKMRVFAHPPPLLSAQALTLYTRDADGSVKAVIAAKAGGLDLTVLPIAQYTGSADASQVRIAAIGSPKPRRRNPETRTRARCARKVSGEKDAGMACRMLFFVRDRNRRVVRRRLVPLTSGHPVDVSLFPLDPLSLKRRPPS